MLTFEGGKGVRFCDGLTRRDFLREGALGAGALGLSLADLAHAVALVGGAPKTLSLLELIREYLDFQREVVTRRSKYELRKAEERAHVLQGYLTALDNLDAAVRAYHRLRAIDTAQDPDMDHEVYAYHGMIQVEMQRERWRRVLDRGAAQAERIARAARLLADRKDAGERVKTVGECERLYQQPREVASRLGAGSEDARAQPIRRKRPSGAVVTLCDSPTAKVR